MLLLLNLPAFALSAAAPYVCAKTPTPKFLDGRLTEWSEPFITLGPSAWRAEAKGKAVYGGPTDLSATLRLSWDAKMLYVAVAVLDDAFVPAKAGPSDSSDAVILRLAPADAPAGAPVTPVELVLAMTTVATIEVREADGTLAKAPGAKLGMARETLKAPDPVPAHAPDKTPAAFLTKLYYEAAIPWTLLPQITPKDGTLIGVEVQVQDNDGPGVRGRLKWRGQPGVPRTATDLGRVLLAPAKP